jgi:hypothetical protein
MATVGPGDSAHKPGGGNWRERDSRIAIGPSHIPREDSIVAAETQEVATVTGRPDDEVLRQINSVQDAFDVLNRNGIDVVDISDELGTGFQLIEDDEGKGTLVKTPFVIVYWGFSLGDYGEFVTAFIMTEDGRKLILTDGSTGIYSQLSEYTEKKGRQAGMNVRRGLRRSDYRISRESREPVGRDFQGETDPATTFYLDTGK